MSLLFLFACAGSSPDVPAAAGPAIQHPDGWLVTAWVEQLDAEAVVAGPNPVVFVFSTQNAVCEMNTNGEMGWDTAIGRNPRVQDVAADGDALAVSEGRAVVLQGDYVYADVDGDGSPGREIRVDGVVAARFVEDDVVVLAEDDGCRVVLVESSEAVAEWSVPDGACDTEALAVDDGAIYVVDGEALYRDGERVAGVPGELLAVRDGVAVVAEDGGDDVRGLDAATGEVSWHHEVEGDLGAVSLGNGLAYATWTRDGRTHVSAWWAEDGTAFETLEIGDASNHASIAAVPALGQVLVVAGEMTVALERVLDE